ncbi:hypothetical protein [Tardiphaga alba]|uniref:hypothetical protein n=1 Tax=Tardiphaga alba TaxID=340268 RepID=UPI00201214E3|nr:hypothetical protein [Tardiphaga alba]
MTLRSGASASIDNAGTITGGAGTNAGSSTDGGTGVQVNASSSRVINNGTIAGGLAGDGVSHGNAVTLAGTNNTLELRTGYAFIGNVVATGSNATLAFGGSSNASFDMSDIGGAAQYRGFATYAKIGSSTWTLTGTTAVGGNWSVAEGILQAGGQRAFAANGLMRSRPLRRWI